MTPYRIGIVESQDAASCHVRVRFPDRDQAVSYWLPIVVRGSQSAKDYWLPEVGEQVVCLMDEFDEDGAVLGSIYSSVDTPAAGMTADKRHFLAADGALFDYDDEAHALTVVLPAGATLSVGASGAQMAIDASGNVTVNGATIALAGGGAGVARAGDPVQVTDDEGGILLTGKIVSGSSKVSSG